MVYLHDHQNGKLLTGRSVTKIPGHEMCVGKCQNLVKLSKDIKFYIACTGKTDKMSENNAIVDNLASCLIMTRILRFSLGQIQNKSESVILKILKF